MNKTEYVSIVSALIENVSADFILPTIYKKKIKEISLKNTNTIQKGSVSEINSDVFYKEKPRISKRTKKVPLIPSQYKEYILKCNKCSQEYEKIDLPETLPTSPYVMVVTDEVLGGDDYSYLGKILASISLDINNKSDVYLTPLIKCKKPLDEYSSHICFSNLEEEIKLTSPYSLLVFGKFSRDLFLKNGAESEVVFKESIPIIMIDSTPLVMSLDKKKKKDLWDSLKLFKKYFISL